MPREVVVKKEEDNPVLLEVFERSIVDIAAAAQKILDGPLTRRAIILLIQDSVPGGVHRDTIAAVLDAAANLEKRYLK